MRWNGAFPRAAAIVLAALFPAARPTAATVPVDVELSLLVDTSGSISDAEYQLQIGSYADLLGDPAVVPHDGSVAIDLVLFASAAHEAVPWTLLADDATAQALADTIRHLPRETGMTALGDGLLAASATFEANGFDGARRVIDVSGDGEVNTGTPIAPARATALQRVDAVNGLAITDGRPQLFDYYRDQVIGGPGAFALEVVDLSTFDSALRVKLQRETARCLAPPAGLVAWWPLDEPTGRLSCDVVASHAGVHAGCPRPVAGKVDGALSFDGFDDQVVVPASAAVTAFAGNFSIAAWVRTDASAGRAVLVDARRPADGVGFALLLEDGAPALALDDGRSSGGGALRVAAAGVADGTWHLVCASVARDAPDGLNLSVDGLPAGSFDAGDEAGPLAGSDLLLGSGRGAPGESPFAGDLDEIVLFDRALGLGEVAALAGAGARGLCKWSAGCSEAPRFADACLWPPDHRYACFDDLAALLPPSSGLTGLRVIGCTASQPDDVQGADSGGHGDGHSVDDCVVARDGSGFCVRSERQGGDRAGRTYTLTLAASADCGDAALATIRLHVPHDMRDHADCLPMKPRDFLLPHVPPMGAPAGAPAFGRDHPVPPSAPPPARPPVAAAFGLGASAPIPQR